MTENDAALIGQTAQAVVKEYAKQKRRSWLIKVAVMVVVISFMFTMLPKSNVKAPQVGEHVAAIRIDGEIFPDTEATLDFLYSGIKEAFENDQVKGVMLLINSPGGSPGVSEPIFQEILYRKAKHDKPVVAVCDFMCASAAYHIAVAADQIYANDEAIIGSIGTYIQGYDARGVADTLKIKPRFFSSGENKLMMHPLLDMTDTQKQFMQDYVASSHQLFINKVVENRGERLVESARKNPTPSHPIFSGNFYSSVDALENGLIDGIGYTQSVAREVFPDMEVLDYTPTNNLQAMLKALGQGPHMLELGQLMKIFQQESVQLH